MTTAEPEDAPWLCRVDWVERDKGTPFGGVQPLASLGSDGEGWKSISADAARLAFPDRGLAFWFDVPAEVEVGDLVSLELERRDKYRTASGESDAFQVVPESRRHVYEVVDLREWEGERAVRVALTQDGLSLSLTTPRVLVRLDDESAAGPLVLERTGDGRWRIPESAREDVEVRTLLDRHVSTVAVGASTPTLVHDRHGVSRPVRLLNWTDDRTLALSLLGRLRKLDPAAVRALDVSKTVYKQYVESFPGFQFSNDRQRDQEAARFHRVAEFVEVVARDERLLDEAARALLDHPRVAEALEEPKRIAVERAQADAREAAMASLADTQAATDDARRERDALDEERTRLVDEIAEAQRGVDEARRLAETRVAEVEAALDSRLSALAAKPAELFAEAAVLRALLPTSMAPSDATESVSVRTNTRPESIPASPTSPTSTHAPSEEVASVSDAAALVSQRLYSAGRDLLLGPALVSTFLTGRALVVVGDGAHDALRTIADALAGGRMTWIPVQPTLDAPDALLGRYDSSSDKFVPHPGGLLEVLDDASVRDRLALVVLEGYDRAPAEHYLVPLVAAYDDAHGSGRARTVPIVSDGGEARRVGWPPNVLLACVPSRGSGAIPPGPAFWEHAALVDVGDAAPAPPSDAPLGELPASVWASACTDHPDVALPFDDPEVAPRASHLARRLYHDALDLGLPPSAARRVAFVAAWLPRFRSADAATDAARTALGSDADPLDDRLGFILDAVRPI